VADQFVNVGVTVLVSNIATDADVPANTLTFSLLAAPTNASLNTNSGILVWRPQVTDSGTTNLVTVSVADNGTPSLSATQSFNIGVNLLTPPNVSSATWTGGQLNFSVNGQSGPDYAVQGSSNLVDWDLLLITNSPGMPFNWTDVDTNAYPARFYRIKAGPPLP